MFYTMEITKTAFRRLAKDVKDIRKNPLHDNNIYYVHNEENILKGYALIIGPEGTPYAHGFYFFEIDYPYDYPNSPPKFTFQTNGDNIRMNPNLYRSGKVCISILNTWHGDPWSSCQTISTVLLTLSTIFNDKPLLNEPGYKETSEDFCAYQKIITFKNVEVAILKVLKEEISIPYYEEFSEITIEYFKNNIKKLTDLCNNNKNVKEIVFTKIYNMRVDINYMLLKTKLVSFAKEI